MAIFGGADWRFVPVLIEIALLFCLPEIVRSARTRRTVQLISLVVVIAVVGIQTEWTRGIQPASTVQVYLEYWPTDLPKTVPPNTQLFVAFAQQDKTTIAFNLIPAPSDPQGKIITWNDRTDPRSMLGGVCRLTNYAGVVLFDVDLLISTEFYEAVRLGPDAFGPGKITAEHDWTIRVPKLEASKQEPFVFYIVNEAQAYVTIVVRDAASASVVGQSGRRTVQLVRMTGGMQDAGLSLTPKDFTKLP